MKAIMKLKYQNKEFSVPVEIDNNQLEEHLNNPEDDYEIGEYLFEDFIENLEMVDIEISEPYEYDDTCGTCQGTGIGQWGDPGTSRCHVCGGSGVKKRERDWDY